MESLENISQDEDQCKSLSRVCVIIHEGIEDFSLKIQSDSKHFQNTTPCTYMELIKQYKSLLSKRTETLITKKDHITRGLHKLQETNEMVIVMSEDLKKFVPIIEEKSNNLKNLLSKLEKLNALAESVKKAVTQEEADAKVLILIFHYNLY